MRTTARIKAEPAKPDGPDEGRMALSGHLRELRRRVVICLAVLLGSMTVGLAFAGDMVGFLLRLGERYQYRFVYISPQELLLEYFAVDLAVSVCVTLPVLLYQLWAFLRPGLKRNERLLFALAMVSGLACAAVGALFAYKILLPFMLRFLISLSVGSTVTAAVSVQNYVSFLLTVFLVFAAVFELPVVAVLLTQLRFLKTAWLRRFRKVAIVAVFFVAAVITPPDVVSQVMVALPLLGLYELSILLCTALDRLRRRKKADAQNSDDG